MADIAAQMQAGKSSLYYYFPSKQDLFQAVVEAEMRVLSEEVEKAVRRQDSPQAQVKAYVLTRMRVVAKLANAYAALHEEYLDHSGFIDRLREQAFRTEAAMLRNILEEGVKTGVFEIADVDLAAYAMTLALKGLEYPWAAKAQQARLERDLGLLVDMLVRAIRK